MTDENRGAKLWQGIVVLLFIIVFLVLVVGCGSSDEASTVKTTTTPAQPAKPIPEPVNAVQLQQRDKVLAAIKLYDETDPAQLDLWEARAKDACELTYDLEVSYQNAFIEAFIEGNCS